jgi:PhnB protein
VKSQPDGYHCVTPYLTVRGAAAAMEFYKSAFGATEVLRLPMPDGSLAHAEVQIGDSKVMFADENPAWGNKSPAMLGGSSGGVMLYVPDADAAFARAVSAGAAVKMPVETQFYGDRCGSVIDPFGHVWTIATHIEDVPPAEMSARMEAWTKSQG